MNNYPNSNEDSSQSLPTNETNGTQSGYNGGIPDGYSQGDIPYGTTGNPDMPNSSGMATTLPQDFKTSFPYGKPMQFEAAKSPLFPVQLPRAKYSSDAIISILSAAIAAFSWWIPILGLVASVMAVVTGHFALKRIKKSLQEGKKLSIIGLIVGYVAFLSSFMPTVNYFSAMV